MSGPGVGDDFNIFASVIFETDPRAAAQTLQEIRSNYERYRREASQFYQRINRLTERAYDAEMRVIAEAARQREAAGRQQERRDVARLQRLAARQQAAAREQLEAVKELNRAQAAADRQRLQDSKQAGDRDLQAQKQRDRLQVQTREHRNKQQRALEREATWIHNEELKRRHKLELQATKTQDSRIAEGVRQQHRMQMEAERRQTHLEQTNQRERLMKEEAHLRRREARTRAFWSVMRSVAETGGRHMVNDTRSAFQRLFSHQQNYERRSLLSWRNHNTQVAAVNRAAIAQQGGVIATARARSQTGVVGGLGNLYGLAAGAGAYLSARAIFGPVADYQQTQIAFESLLGSAERAENFLSEMREFAVETPFRFEGVAEGARRLLAVGFAARDVVPALTDIGNVAATLGVGEVEINGVIRALGQMRGKGKASAEELQQISEQLPGFSAVEAIAESLGITTAEAFEQMRAGAISGEQGVQAILEGMRNFTGAAGAMDRQSETINGRLSTLQDTMTNLVIDALSPFADEMADLIGKFTEFLTLLFEGSGVWAVARSGILGVAAALGALVAIKVADWARIAIVGINPLMAGFFALGAGLSILIRHVPEVGDAFRSMVDVVSGSFDQIRGAFAALFTGDIEGFTSTFSDLGQRMWDAIRPAFEFIADRAVELYAVIAPAVVAVWDQAFGAVADWIESGGIGRIVDAVRSALGTAFSAVSGFVASNLQPILLAGVTALALSTIGLIPTVLVAAVGGIAFLYRDRIADALDGLTGLLMEGLHRLGEFLGGPVVSTIFSKTGQKIMLAILAGALAGVASFATGLVDGLRESLPKVFDAFNDIVQDEITAAFDSLGILGDALWPIEVALRSITGTMEAFVRVVMAIPPPLLILGAALVALQLKYAALIKTFVVGKWTAITTAVTTMSQRIIAAGMQMQTFAAQMRNSSLQAHGMWATVGGAGQATRANRALNTLGGVVAGVGRAFPAISVAAAVGIPVVMGLVEQAKARQREWRNQILETAEAMSEGASTMSDAIRSLLEGGAAGSLSEFGLGFREVQQAILGGAESIGRLYASLDPRIGQYLDATGLSVEQFGRAVAEGDQAVEDLGQSVSHLVDPNSGLGNLGAIWRDLPEPLRDIADQSTETARSFLIQQLEAGNLTREQARLFAEIEAGERPQVEFISLSNQITTAQERQRLAIDRNREIVEALTADFIEARDESTSFREAIQSLTGSAIEVGRSRQSLEATFDAIRDGIAQGEGVNDLADEILSAADGVVGVFEALAESGRPIREARGEYRRLRGELVNQYVALGFNREQAEAYTSALIPDADEIIREMRRAQRETERQLRRQRRQLQNALLEGGLNVRQRAAVEEMLGEIEATMLSYGLELPFTVRLDEDSDAAAAWRERIEANLPDDWFTGAEGTVNVPVGFVWTDANPLPGASPLMRAQGITGPGGGAGAGAGGGPGGLPAIDGWRVWAQSVAAIMADVARITGKNAQKMIDVMNGVLRDIDRGFKRWGSVMTVAAGQIGTSIWKALATALKAGTTEVSGIVRGYGRTIVNSLNPILRSVGKDPIQLSFARGGIPGPNIAAPGDGPIVHVYNEGLSGTGSRHGEAYIPFDPTMKSRSRGIASRAVERLGGKVQWFAQGGITSPVPNVAGNWQGLHPEFARRLSAWATALGTTYTVGSGYRSFAQQAKLYADYIAGVPGQAPAAPPGTSLHNFGLASDGSRWSNRGEGAFRLAYPMSYEPWHVQVAEGKGFIRDGFVPFNPIERPPDAGQRGILSRVGKAVMDFTYQAVLTYASSLTGSMGAPGLGSFGASPQVMAGIREAMRIVGVPSTWLNPLLTLIERESGFNPRAYNGVLGASGLMQTIPSTFAAYALPGLGGIFDIVANVVAGLRYILARYGTIFNVGQATSPTPTSGYYSGGLITGDGLYRAGEFGRRELVLPIDNPRRTASLLASYGIAEALNQVLDVRDGRSATSRSQAPKVDININLEGGDIDPMLYDGLVGAVRSGVAEGMARADRVEDDW